MPPAGAGGGGACCAYWSDWSCSICASCWYSRSCDCARCLPAMYAPPPTAAARRRGRRRINGIALLRLLVGQAEPERQEDLGGGGDDARAADLRSDRAQDAEDVLRRGAVLEGVGDLPDVRGGRSIERDERGDLHQGERAGVQPGAFELRLAQAECGLQQVDVAHRDPLEGLVGIGCDGGHQAPSSSGSLARR